MKKVLIPISSKDFDTTEVALTWKILSTNNLSVTFATIDGKIGETDPLLLTGVLFGQLGAKPNAIAAYRELQQAPEFLLPILFSDINPKEYDLLFLPGGHAKGMRPYLENKVLQDKIVQFFKLEKQIACVCHGSLLLARSIDPETGKSIVYNYQFTGLPKSLERLAYGITKWKLDDYYKTYETYMQDEVETYLKDKAQFKTGFSSFIPFVYEDRNLTSARWPLDIEKLANRLVEKLK